MPQLMFALAWLARYEPASELIAQIVMAELRVRPRISGESLWLQRRAFLHAVAAHGFAFFIAYARHCGCMLRWNCGGGRPPLLYYGVVKTQPSSTDCQELLNELDQYVLSPAELGHVALERLLCGMINDNSR